MIPWSEPPRADRSIDIMPGHPTGVSFKPDYAAPVEQDQRWYEWAKERYGGIWGQLISVV